MTFWLALLIAFAPLSALAQNFGNIPPRTTLGNPDTAASRPAAPIPFSAIASGKTPQDFGAKGDGVADDTTEIQAMFTSACTNKHAVWIPDGTYNLTATITINGPCAGLTARFQSKNAVFQYTGTTNVGAIVALDGSGTAPSLGNLLNVDFGGGTISGNTHTQSALVLYGTQHSHFHDLKLTNVIGAALLGSFMVADTFANISTSNLELPGGVFATKPAQCMNFQELFPPHRGATDVTIINAICEGVSADGWVLQKSSGNVFVGGTSESNTGRGIVVDATSERNTFLNVDVENNTGEDVTVAGNYNQIINMTASSVVGSPVHIVQGTNNTISGGTFNRLTIDAAAANTLLSNVRYNMAGGGLTNNSTTTAIINSTDGTTTTTQLRGVTTATAPPAGMIGEELVSTVVIGSAVPLVNGAAKTVTSIVLTPGDWDVTGIGYFTGSSATKVAYIYATLSPIDNGLDQDPGRSGVMPFFYTAPLLTDINQVSQDAGTSRFTVAANTTVYLVVQASFNSGTWSAFGYLRARRMR